MELCRRWKGGQRVNSSCFGGFDRAVAPFIRIRQGQALRLGERCQVALENNRKIVVRMEVGGVDFLAIDRQLIFLNGERNHSFFFENIA